MEVINYKGNNYKSGATLDEDINFTDYSGEFEIIEGEIDDYIFEYEPFSPIPLTFIRVSNKKFKFYFNKTYEEFVKTIDNASYHIWIKSQNNEDIFTINFNLKGFEKQVDSFSYNLYYRPFYFNGALLMSRHDLTDYNEFITSNTIMDENTEYCELFYSIANGCSYKQKDIYKLGEVKLQLNDNILTIKEPFRSFNELEFNSSGESKIDAVSAVYGIREPYLKKDENNVEEHGIIFRLNETGTTYSEIIVNDSNKVQDIDADEIVMKTIHSNFNVTLSVSEKEIMGYESFSETISSTVANVFFPKTIIYNIDGDNCKLGVNLDVYQAKFFRLGDESMLDIINSLRLKESLQKEDGTIIYSGISCNNIFENHNFKHGWDSIFTPVVGYLDDNITYLTTDRLIKNGDTFKKENTNSTKFIMAIYDIYTENYNDVVNGATIQWQVKNDLTPKDTSRFSVIKIYKGRIDENNVNQIIFE